jgi:ribonuclease HI
VQITDPSGAVVDEIAEPLGVATNNVAEYTAAVRGLQRAADLGGRDVILRADSLLLIRQLAGRYKVKNPRLRELHAEASMIAARFERIRYEHVARELNREADRLANVGVDSGFGSLGSPHPDSD